MLCTNSGPTRDTGHAAHAAWLRDWERRGVLGPVEALTRHEAARIARDFRKQYARSGVAGTRNRHVDLRVLAELCDNAGIWLPAHAILGDELLLWRTRMFLGNPRLPWHEDRHAELFVRKALSLSVLLAIEDSPPDNCTVIVAASHKLSVGEKEARYGITASRKAGGSVRYRGEVAAGFHEALPLRAGEMILFHPKLLHASAGFTIGGDPVTHERMSIAFRVTSPNVELRDEAFPEERRDLVLRTLRRASGEAADRSQHVAP